MKTQELYLLFRSTFVLLSAAGNEIEGQTLEDQVPILDLKRRQKVPICNVARNFALATLAALRRRDV